MAKVESALVAEDVLVCVFLWLAKCVQGVAKCVQGLAKRALASAKRALALAKCVQGLET